MLRSSIVFAANFAVIIHFGGRDIRLWLNEHMYAVSQDG